MALFQTFGDLVNFNPHLHVLAADGVFLPSGRFVALPRVPGNLLAEGFRHAVLDFLVKREALSKELRARMLAWRHGGFSVHNEVSVAAEDAEGRKTLAGYLWPVCDWGAYRPGVDVHGTNLEMISAGVIGSRPPSTLPQQWMRAHSVPARWGRKPA
jgi:hypothetical protein